MGLIYQTAEVTLIAAAGEGPEHGLPGIRRRTISQPQGQIGKHFLVSPMMNLIYTIIKSKWMTRAWTYQEAISSRRRLVFTDEQMYFECCGMYCCEALDLPLLDLHTHDLQQFQPRFCNGISTGMLPRELGANAWEFVVRVEEYSRRKLTNRPMF
jgi:hypothetical protein